jgi:CrcB protein
MSWQILISVALGGAAGATLRFLAIQFIEVDSGFPAATMLVNIIGSFAIGILYVVILEKGVISEFWRPLLMVGLLGGLTTFSAFSLEVVNLMQDGRLIAALNYVVFSVLLCILAAFFGMQLTRHF